MSITYEPPHGTAPHCCQAVVLILKAVPCAGSAEEGRPDGERGRGIDSSSSAACSSEDTIRASPPALWLRVLGSGFRD